MTTNLQIEPKLGEIITINGVKYITQLASGVNCSECAFQNVYCWNIACNPLSRKDSKAVIFKKVETNMNEVKIQVPDKYYETKLKEKVKYIIDNYRIDELQERLNYYKVRL